MHLSLSQPTSNSYERVKWLVATWCKPGAAFLGGGTGVTPPTTEFCLLLNTDTGAGTLTVQLNTDTGTNTHCVELNPSTP